MKQLWAHQEEALNLLKKNRSFALHMEPRTGKTAVALKWLESISQDKNLKILILAPPVATRVWEKELHVWWEFHPSFAIASGSTEKKLKTISLDPEILITNYESLISPKIQKALVEFAPNVLICDESHRCKNPSAKRSKEVKKIANRCTYRLNLTGTPVTKSYLDLFQQFLILDGGQTFGNNFYSFRAKYFEDKNASRRGAHNYFPDWVIRKDSQVVINKILSKRAYAKRKVDCLELPPFETVNVPVEMTPKQAKAYQEMKEDFITFVEGVDSPSVAKFAMTKALRLQQISSGFLQTETEMIELDNQRQVVLSDLLEDLPSPIVVWACFKPNYKAIAKVCENLGKKYALLTGEQNQKEKDTAMNRWDNGEIDVLIANQGAGGIGINLSKSSNSIYYSYNFNFEHDEQSEARIYSTQSNQFSKITRYNLVSEGTIDSQILKSLKEKSLTLDSILGACK